VATLPNQIRNPVDKEKFLAGNRQRWALIAVCLGTLGFFMAGFVPAFVQLLPNFLSFLTITITALILGKTIDSGMKINHQTKKENNEALISRYNMRNQHTQPPSQGDQGYE